MSAPGAIGENSTRGGPPKPRRVRFTQDIEKRIEYFRKCSKLGISSSAPQPFDYAKTDIPDSVAPEGCMWKWEKGQDPNDVMAGSGWSLVMRDPANKIVKCDKEYLDADPNLEVCPPGSSKGGPPPPPPKCTSKTCPAPGHCEGDKCVQGPPPPPPPGPDQPLPTISGEVIEDDDPSGVTPNGTEKIKLTGRDFYIEYSKADRARRSQALLTPGTGAELNSEETELLETIGITDTTREAVKPYLPDFFNALPSCQSTTTLMTSRKCEVAYYIMWSVLLKARQDVQRKIDAARVAGLSDKEVYQMEARLNAMSNVKGTGSVGDKTFAALSEHAKQSHDEHMHIEEILGRIEGKIDVLKTDVNVVKAKKGGSRSRHSGSGYVKTGLAEIRRLFTRV